MSRAKSMTFRDTTTKATFLKTKRVHFWPKMTPAVRMKALTFLIKTKKFKRLLL